MPVNIDLIKRKSELQLQKVNVTLSMNRILNVKL